MTADPHIETLTHYAYGVADVTDDEALTAVCALAARLEAAERDLAEARAENEALRGLVDLYRPAMQREYEAFVAEQSLQRERLRNEQHAQEPPAESACSRPDCDCGGRILAHREPPAEGGDR